MYFTYPSTTELHDEILSQEYHKCVNKTPLDELNRSVAKRPLGIDFLQTKFYKTEQHMANTREPVNCPGFARAFSFRTSFNLPPINNTSSANSVDTLNLASNFFNDPKFTGVAGKKIVLVIKGKTTGTNGTKSFALRLGGSPFVSSLPATAVDDFEVHFNVQFIGPGSQIFSSMRYMAAGTAYPNNDVKSIDMSVE